jgi:hypothetical protein
MPLDEVTEGVFDRAISEFRMKAQISNYFNDPVAFARDILGIELWSKQREMVQSVQDNKHTIVRSCHGSGKSLTSSVIVCWWIATRPLGSAIAVTTAPTYQQVSAILWEEIRKHHANAKARYEQGLSPMKLPGYVTQGDQWKSDDGQLLGFGRKPADGNQHAFQGIHRRYVLAVIDEACGINKGLYTAVEAITNTGDARVLAVGNPDDPVTEMGEIFRKDPTWNKIGISAFDSPNFSIEHLGHKPAFCEDCAKFGWNERAELDKDVSPELRPYLIQHDWVMEKKISWGEDSPLWKSKVLGEFPDQSVNTLFNIGTIYKGQNTSIIPLGMDKVVMGVDVAGFGPDYSTIYINQNGHVRFVDKMAKGTGEDTARWIHQTALSNGANEVRIDSTGLGGPITEMVTRLAETTYDVVAMKGNAASPDRFRWANARAYWYDDLRERMFSGKIDIDEKDEKLAEELGIVQYHFKNRLQALQIESKDDMRSRGLKSPDFADAAVYATANMDNVYNNPFGSLAPGDKFSIDAATLLGAMQESSFGPY